MDFHHYPRVPLHLLQARHPRHRILVSISETDQMAVTQILFNIQQPLNNNVTLSHHSRNSLQNHVRTADSIPIAYSSI